MPRIDPLQLLGCLEVLLTPTGGIKCEEVARISSLMDSFSKKLVSKAVYLLILKATENHLLDSFMGHGGWDLIRNWLSHALNDCNWPLLREILQVLIICPVNVDRLKSNELPRLVKYSSKAPVIPADIRDLATSIVQNWLVVVKAATQVEENSSRNLNVSGSDVVNENSNSECTNNATKSEPETIVTAGRYISSTDHAFSGSPVKVPPNKTRKRKNVTSSDKSDQIIVSGSNKKKNSLAEKKELVTENKSTRSQTLRMKAMNVKELIKTDTPPKETKIDTVNSALKRKLITPDDNVPKNKIAVAKGKNTASDKTSSRSKAVNTLTEKKINKPLVSLKNKEAGSKLKIEQESDNKKPELAASKKAPECGEENLKNRTIDKGTSKKSSVDPKKLKEEVGSNESDDKKLEKFIVKKDNAETLKSKVGGSIQRPDAEVKMSNEKDKTSLNKKAEEKTNSKKVDPVPKKTVSISIEKRFGNNEEKPKTVKMYNSKFRLTGLEDAASVPPKPPIKKPPLSEKKTLSLETTTEKKPALTEKKMPTLETTTEKKPLLAEKKTLNLETTEKKPLVAEKKTPSLETTMEKKPKSSSQLSPTTPILSSFTTVLTSTENSEKKDEPAYAKGLLLGSVNKPKKAFIQESGSFIDAMLNAAQTPKEQMRKRKKSQKDNGSADESKDGKSIEIDQSAPKLRFYKDTLETSSSDEDAVTKKGESRESENKTKKNVEIAPDDMTESDENRDRAKGILKCSSGRLSGGRSHSKKAVRWKDDKDLESVQYFEVDASERSNVSRTFGDMQMRERCDERETLLKARNQLDDYTNWLKLIPIDLEPTNRVPGSNSAEKDIQYLREKTVPEVIYFSKHSIPDSPMEPDVEIYTHTDPVIIPAEDVADTINEYGNCQWPEPKMNDPDLEPPIHMATIPLGSGGILPDSNIYNQFLANASTFPQNPSLAAIPYGPNAGVAAVPLAPNWNSNPSGSLPSLISSQIVTVPSHMVGLPVASHPAQFVHPSGFINPNVYVSSITPTTTAVLPTESSSVVNWTKMPVTTNTNDKSNNISQNAREKEWNSNSDTQDLENPHPNFPNGPSWNYGDSAQSRRGRGGFHDRGRFNNRGGLFNRGGAGKSDRGEPKNLIKHPDSHTDQERKSNDRPYPRELSWRNPSANNWRGNFPNSSSTRLCRYIKQKGFCSINGCRFFHP